MPDPIDLNNPPATPPTLSDPQDVVDAALATEPVASTPPPTPDPIPTPAPATVPMGDEMPLAFVTPPPTTTTTTQPVDDAAPLPPVPPVVPMAAEQPKKKKSVLKIVGLVIGLFVGLGIVGSVAYQTLTGESLIAILQPKGRVREIDNPGDCDGESNGGWLVWRNGECKVTGISGSEDKNNDGVGDKDTANPNGDPIADATSKSACESNSNGLWCASVDSNNKPYAFCIDDRIAKGCNQYAVEKGYTIQLGIVKCVCSLKDSKTGACIGVYNIDLSDPAYANASSETKAAVDTACGRQLMGTGSYICKEGVKGVGGQVYSGGQCTELNGKKYSGKLDCFCGVVQVDTGTGHVSYSSQCGCDKKSDETTTTTTTTPTMACTGLTRVPTTAPSEGQAVTFSCAGSVTPSTAGTLSYKYRYSLNSGSYLPMTSNVLTIAACGSYSVQCQACATLNGVLTCDPIWTGATP